MTMKQYIKKTIALLVLLMTGTTAWGAWDGTTRTQPTETETIEGHSYTIINTEAEWAWLCNNWQNGERYIKLNADLDMGGHVLEDIIGGTSYYVSGVIYGNNKTISNLHVVKNNRWETGGIVGYMYNCTLKNLHVVNGLVESTESGNYGIGGLVGGYGGNSTITGCSFQGTVDAGDKDYVGGIVGKPVSDGWVITNCYFDGTVIGNNYVGAIIGQIGSSTIESGNTYSDTSSININGVAIYGNGTDIKIGKKASDFITYALTKVSTTNGSFTVKVGAGNATKATAGAPITINTIPATGYVVNSVSVVDASSNSVKVTKSAANAYTFTMPASNVTITVTFGEPGNYLVKTIANSDGTITSNKETANKNEVVTLTVTPNDGKIITASNIIVTKTGTADMAQSRSLDDSPLGGSDITVTAVSVDARGSGTYQFTMPNTNVEISATFTNNNNLSAATIGVSGSYTYDGTPQIPSASVTLSGTPLTSNDYTLLYYLENGTTPAVGTDATTAPTNAGSYKVKAQGKNTYTGTTTTGASFTINKAELSITAKPKVINYGDAPTNDGVEYSGFVNSENKSVLGGTLVYSYNYNQYDNVGTYTITPSGLTSGNYTISFVTGSLTVNPKVVTSPTITLGTTSYTYDGTEKKPIVTVKDGEILISADEYTVSYEDNINVGTATVKITDKDGGNYTVSGSTTFAIAAADGSLTPPTAKTGLVYTGSPMDLITAGSSTTGTVQYSLDGSTYSATIPQGEEAKEYTVYYKVVANSGYKDVAAQSFKVAIAPKPVTSPTITLGNTSYSYDGKEKKPTVTVKDGETTIPASEYTVSYEDNVNVGTATVKIADKDGGNYTVNGSTTFGIAAADGSLTPPTAKTGLVYTGSPMDLITAGSSTTGTVQYSLDGSTYSATIPQGEEAKEYTVYYKVVANSGYKDVAAQSFKVAIAPKAVSAPTITLSETSYTYDGTEKKPTVTVKDGDTTIPADEYTVSYEDNVKVGTATVKIADVEGGNYIVNGSATFSITQDMQTVEVETEEDKTVKTDIAATITDEENKEVTITDADIPASEVGSTEAAIPPTVEIGGETYTVTEIADNAFAGKSEITDIYLPDTEEPITIGVDALKISDTEIARVHTPLALLDDYALDKELEQHVEADKLMATVTPPNQYWTFSCGIDVKVPEGVKVYKCILNEEGTAVVIIEISEADLGGIIKANNGVLLSSTAGNPYDIIASKNDDITTIADRDEKSYGRDNLLEPVIESANYAADEYYVLYNNEFRAIISNNSKVPACKAVLHKPAGVSASRSLDIDEDETTGIRHFYAFPDSDGDWYDIKGQRVDRPAQRGVYIQKGKKIIIK